MNNETIGHIRKKRKFGGTIATLCGAPMTDQDIAFNWPSYVCPAEQLCEACINLRENLMRQARQDSGIRTEGILCADDCCHLLAAGRYGPFRCTGFTCELTGPGPTKPFRCQKCLDMRPSRQ